jgi:hypothetical protein
MRQLILLALNKLYVCTPLHIEGKIDSACWPSDKLMRSEKERAFVRWPKRVVSTIDRRAR